MDIFEQELLHYAKGSTKKNAKYAKREFRNGRWVYYYPDDIKGGKVDKNKYDYNNKKINDEMYKADYSGVRHDAKFTERSSEDKAGKTVKSVSDAHYSNAESLKRQQASALAASQRKQKDKLANDKAYQLKARFSYYVGRGQHFVEEYIKGHEGKVHTHI